MFLSIWHAHCVTSTRPSPRGHLKLPLPIVLTKFVLSIVSNWTDQAQLILNASACIFLVGHYQRNAKHMSNFTRPNPSESYMEIPRRTYAPTHLQVKTYQALPHTLSQIIHVPVHEEIQGPPAGTGGLADAQGYDPSWTNAINNKLINVYMRSCVCVCVCVCVCHKCNKSH